MSLDIWALRIHWENNCPNLQDAAPPTRFTLVSELTDSFPLPLLGLDVMLLPDRNTSLKPTHTHTGSASVTHHFRPPLGTELQYSIVNYWNSISLLSKSGLSQKNTFFVSQWTVFIEGTCFQNLYTNSLKKKNVPLNHVIISLNQIIHCYKPPAVMSTQRRPHPRWGNETQRSNLSLIKKDMNKHYFLLNTTTWHRMCDHTLSSPISAHTAGSGNPQLILSFTSLTVWYFAVRLLYLTATLQQQSFTDELIFHSFYVILWLKLSCHLSHDKQTKYSDGTFYESLFYM